MGEGELKMTIIKQFEMKDNKYNIIKTCKI